MFKSYWTMAWRTLVRNKIYTLVNVLGLALGVCGCLVIWVIVRYEFSFDRNHPGGSRIYRLNSYEQFMKDEPERLVPAVFADLPEVIRKEVPGVEIVAPYHYLDHDTATVIGTGKQEASYPATPIAAGASLALLDNQAKRRLRARRSVAKQLRRSSRHRYWAARYY